jgi:hypothetical protein
MPDLLQLSIRVADLATRPARFAVGTLLRFVRDETPEPVHAPAPEPVADHPQTRPAPAPRRPRVKAARRAVRHEPTKGEAAAIREAQREAEWGNSDGPGANVVIDEAVLRAAGSGPDKP